MAHRLYSNYGRFVFQSRGEYLPRRHSFLVRRDVLSDGQHLMRKGHNARRINDFVASAVFFIALVGARKYPDRSMA